MKNQSIFQRLKAMLTRKKYFFLAITLAIFSVGCILPFAVTDPPEDEAEVARVETIEIPTATKPEPSSTLVSTATLTNTATSTVTPTQTPTSTSTQTQTPTFTPTSTQTQTPTPTQAQFNLNSCLPENATVQNAKVEAIVDGDTIKVNIDGVQTTVRYIGVDTPERGDSYYQEASNRNSDLVLGKDVLLVKDVSETDQYDRLLRYVFVDGVFINEVLVQEGYALAKEYPPDTSCRQVLSDAQTTATTRVTGIWEATPTVAVAMPTTSVATTQSAGSTASSCPTGCLEEVAGCDIKGNINSKGVKIYHDHSSRSYSQTKIDPSKGERWFCTAGEAVANGWRAPNN